MFERRVAGVGRLTHRELPPYAYRPGRHPHPRHHPAGHSFAEPEPQPTRFELGDGAPVEPYLYALDLFDAGYWWESHVVLEALALAWAPASAPRRLLRALVQLAASELQRELGSPGAERLARRALSSLDLLPPRVLGVDVVELRARVRGRLEGSGCPVDPLAIPLALANVPE